MKELFKMVILISIILITGWQKTQANNNKDLEIKYENQDSNNPNYQFQIIPGVCSGLNFDVELIGNKFCLISDKYYELDSTGTVLSSDPTVIDIGQDGYDFCPAIAVSKDSSVHIISRVGGEKENGFDLAYSRKQFGKEWLVKNKLVGKPIARNYIIDIVTSGDSAIYAHTESVDGVSGIIHFYSLKGDICDSIGAISTGRVRIDSDFKMKAYKDSLFVASGFPYANGCIYYMHAKLDDNLPQKLYESSKKYEAGKNRKGQPDIDIDQNGVVHIVYGAKYEVYYSSIRQEQEIVTNKIVMNELGEWHLSLGLSNLAVSDDGQTILAIGLKTNNTNTASHCDILWSLSKDGGQTWTYPQNMDVDTYGAEGRLRPTLLHSNGKFYLFYYDHSVSSISMAIMEPGDNDIEQVAQPTISPVETDYDNSVQISMTAGEETRIFYTTNGTEPAINSDEYLSSISLTKTSTVKAFACVPGYYPSEVSEQTYNITLTGVNDIKTEGISIYPNPGSKMITVTGFDKALELKIEDMLGKVVYQKGYAEKSTQIDISNLKKGLYLISVKKENNIHITKFIKN